MLGNDVVDLNLAKKQSNWKRKGYLSKILLPKEESLVLSAENPDVMLWLIWSMKEAAYKIVNRNNGLRFYDPQAFSCEFKVDGAQVDGTVHFKKEVFRCITEITENYVHTTALQKESSFSEVSVLKHRYSKDYIDEFNSLNTDLQINKTAKILPEIISLATKKRSLASISHHGEYLYIVYLNNFA
jgi:phosphopantetheinyl transferase (holo-ACP synthase)